MAQTTKYTRVGHPLLSLAISLSDLVMTNPCARARQNPAYITRK